MIEIIYNKEKEKATGNEEYFCVPRNIRQIGEVPKENKIYLEDYVHTYLTGDWKDEEPKGKMAILLGKYNWKQGVAYIFIKSAVTVEGILLAKDSCIMTDDQWGTVYEEMKQYFSGQEVVGWYLSLPDGNVEVNDGIVKTHLKHFGGNDKVLFLADPCEKENAFFLYRNNRMEKQNGYYLFYEKNNPMQEYMLMKNPEEPIDFSGKIQDRAIQDFRKIIEKKQIEKLDKGNGMSWGAVACMGIVALSLAVGAAWVTVQKNASSQNDQPASTKVTSVIEEAQSNKEDAEVEEDGMVLLTPEPTKEREEPVEDTENDLTSVENETAETDQETMINVYTKYTVRSGDTLSKISMRYYGDFSKVTEICKINNLLEEDVIYPGQTILLP